MDENSSSSLQEVFPENILSSPQENLPYTALVKIFHYLKNPDRLNAALVCKHWHEAFCCPVLWRRLELELKDEGVYLPRQLLTAIKFARRFGPALHHLVIDCSPLGKSNFYHVLTDHLPTFIEIIARQSQIHTFKMTRFGFGRLPMGIANLLLDSLKVFFASQRNLEVLDLFNADIILEDGVELLHTASQHSGPILKELRLNYFFFVRECVSRNNLFAGALSKFTNLNILVLYYRYLSDEIIDFLATNGQLRILDITCNSTSVYDKIISESAWRRLKSRCPALKVHFCIGPMRETEIITRILTPSMPMAALHYSPGNVFHIDLSANVSEDYEGEIELFNLITKNYSSTLEDIFLSFYKKESVPIAAIENLFRSCEKLKKVTMTGYIPFQLFNTVLSLLDDKQWALENLELSAIDPVKNSGETEVAVFTSHKEVLESMHLTNFTVSSSLAYHYLIVRLTTTKHP